jgi:hypothetical protein
MKVGIWCVVNWLILAESICMILEKDCRLTLQSWTWKLSITRESRAADMSGDMGWLWSECSHSWSICHGGFKDSEGVGGWEGLTPIEHEVVQLDQMGLEYTLGVDPGILKVGGAAEFSSKRGFPTIYSGPFVLEIRQKWGVRTSWIFPCTHILFALHNRLGGIVPNPKTFSEQSESSVNPWTCTKCIPEALELSYMQWLHLRKSFLCAKQLATCLNKCTWPTFPLSCKLSFCCTCQWQCRDMSAQLGWTLLTSLFMRTDRVQW